MFPGFAKEVEGTEEHDGTYHVYCLKLGAKDARAASRELQMTSHSVKPPTIPIPFHRLLKVVALVDRRPSADVRALLDLLVGREASRSRSATNYDRDPSEDADVGAYIVDVDGGQREQRARARPRRARASASARRSGRWPIRARSADVARARA